MIQGDLAAHLLVERYGGFLLTDAIRPARHLPVVPHEGFRFDVFREGRHSIPVLTAAVSRERLFDCFLALLHPLGGIVDVVLETSHGEFGPGHRDLGREGIDMPVLLSALWEDEDLLVNDGCTGVAVMAPDLPAEVQFDEHKLLTVYADDLEPFEAILRQAGVPRVDDLRLITEGEHLHSTEPRHLERFRRLCDTLALESVLG